MEETQPEINSLFELAVKYTNQTNCNLFVTGRAGTGKTTFLHHIVKNSLKKSVIVAPTGVAAINAGGVTIHSLFQLPFGLFLPDYPFTNTHNTITVNNKYSLLQHAKMGGSKRKLLQELELLIIDEVSMVKADTFDAIDTVLRHIRRRPNEVFGGVQLLCIGDLFQLPPVVREDEWKIMSEYYKTPFFFDSNTAKDMNLIKIEFEKVYRQNNRSYISLLNRIRENRIEYEDLEDLNHNHYKPDFTPPEGENYITLCSHNAAAEEINRQQLKNLTTPEHYFEAEISDDFAENMFPTPRVLILKAGAQVMFIKNDSGNDRKFYNGKLALIDHISQGEIWVKFEDETELFKIPKLEWENIRYNFNNNTRKIEEKKLGSFKQYPIKLAWAVTIHKSQGLTFERAIVDAGRSFSEGQVYVALSRLTSPEGLILKTPIEPRSVRSSEQVVEFMEGIKSEDELDEELPNWQKEYLNTIIINNLSLTKLEEDFTLFLHSMEDTKVPDRVLTERNARKSFAIIVEMNKVSQKFTNSLSNNILPNAPKDGYEYLSQRIESATAYFTKELEENLLFSIAKYRADIRKEKITRKFNTLIQNLNDEVEIKIGIIKSTNSLVKGLVNKGNIRELLDEYYNGTVRLNEQISESPKVKKVEKGDSQRMTLTLFKEGKTIPEIMELRALASSTIEGHLAGFVLTGELSPFELLDKEKLKNLVETIKSNPTKTIGEIKQKLGESCTFGELRIAQNYWKYLLNLKKQAISEKDK
ncbi:MAG: helix-turn-helix domain-containing protein [Bacteroidetes bacterium]|nr:helix-turn-helix domain-containing protein [Bacteroidota bacterium]